MYLGDLDDGAEATPDAPGIPLAEELLGTAAAPVPSFSSIADVAALSNITPGYQAVIRDGLTAGGRDSASWTAGPTGSFSDAVDLSTGDFGGHVEPFVLQMNYVPTSDNLMLGWYNVWTSAWVNAVDGNSFVWSTYFDGGWDQYLVQNPGATAYSALGTWGQDKTTNTVWAAVVHNSCFAVIATPVPEPAVLALAGGGLTLFGLAIRRRYRRPRAG